MLLQSPKLGLAVEQFDWLLSLEQAGPKILHRLLEIIHKNPTLSSGALLEFWRDDKLYQRLAELAITEREERIRGNEAQEIADCFKALLQEARTQRLDHLQQKSSQEGLSAAEKAEFQQLLLLSKRQNN